MADKPHNTVTSFYYIYSLMRLIRFVPNIKKKEITCLFRLLGATEEVQKYVTAPTRVQMMTT